MQSKTFRAKTLINTKLKQNFMKYNSKPFLVKNKRKASNYI